MWGLPPEWRPDYGGRAQDLALAHVLEAAGTRTDLPRSELTHVPMSGLCADPAAILLRMERFDVRADAQLDDDNVMLTLSGDSWLLNVNASPVEWATSLPRVPGADHAQRLDVSLGTCARHPVWWSVSDGQLTMSVGQDVESCDLS